MNKLRKVFQLCALAILWVGLTASIGYAACSPLIGYGTNTQCVQGDSCGETCGVTTSWCITETCSQNLTCAGSDQYTGCILGGCLNGLWGNCSTCGS
jgi:hypothetical protein